MRTPRRILRHLGSPRLGIALIIAFAIYAALASLPLFPAQWLDPSAAVTETARVTLRHLPFIDKSEGEYFAWWPGVSLLIAIVINMTISMLTRVTWSWRKTPIFLTHAGVLLLALGSAIYAAQKQEGEILLLSPETGDEAGPAVSEILDKSRVAIEYRSLSQAQSTVVELHNLPRFNARGGAREPDYRLPAGRRAPTMPGDGWSGFITAYSTSAQLPPTEDRSASSIDVLVSGGRRLITFQNVLFSRHSPVSVAGKEWPDSTVTFGPLRIPTPGISLALQSITIDLIPGTDTARNVTAQVRTNNTNSPNQEISLNHPLTLPALAPQTCDCLIRGTLESLWHTFINPVHWKFSIAGWDQEGWLMSREATIAGIADKPRANFILLGVGTTPGTRIITTGAVLLALGAAWALLVSTFRPAARSVVENAARMAASPAALIAIALFSISRPAAAQTTLDPTSPLRTLPVQWNGRTAPLDTVARDIVRAVSNRATIPQRNDASQQEDPLATLLDIVLDPDTAAARPLISTSAVRINTDKPLPKLISINEAKSLLQSARDDDPDQIKAQRNLAPLAERLSLATITVRALPMVAPPRTNTTIDLAKADWLDPESTLVPPPITAALDNLRDAWREGVARTTTIAANRFAEVLRAHNQSRYDRWRVWMEAFVNALAPLKWSAWLYALAAALGLWAFIRSAAAPTNSGDNPNDPPDRTPAEHAHRLIFALAWLVHAAGFACRWVIAGRIPIQNQYESMIGLSLAACSAAGLFALFAPRRNRSAPPVLLAANTISLIVLWASHTLSIPGSAVEPEAAILGTASLLKYHVVTVLVAYSFIAVGGMISAAWLITRAIRPRREDLHHPLAAAIPILIRLSFWTLAVGILLGALWADRSWGRWWAFDPKETWALITWLVYLIALHIGAGRNQTKDATPTVALLSILGTLVMLWSWFGVNLLLPGLHAYAGN